MQKQQNKVDLLDVPGLGVHNDPSRCQQMLGSDRELPDADTGRVPHGIGDRRTDADCRQLADAACADGARVWVVLIHESHIEVRNVGVTGTR